MKRIISIFVTTVLLITVIMSCNNNKSELTKTIDDINKNDITEVKEERKYFIIGDLNYEIIDTNKVVIVRCNTSVTEVDIPTTIIYNNIEYLIVGIEYGAFEYCSKLKSIIIPNGINCINNNTFYNCTNLSSVIIPNSVTHIGEGAFRYCVNLASINIPDNIRHIDNYAFSNCTNLTSINIPNSVSFIGSGVFNECEKLTSIIIPSKVKLIKTATFRKCKSLTSIIIPNNIEEIRKISFSDCVNLTTVTIGASIRNIKSSAFYGCTNLKTITCLAKEPPTLDGKDIFPTTATLLVPQGCKDKYINSDWNNYFNGRIKEME